MVLANGVEEPTVAQRAKLKDGTEHLTISQSTLALALLTVGVFNLELRGQSARPTYRADANLVLVPVTVSDSQYRPILGLRAEDFNVYQDGAPLPITSFSATDAPVSLVLVFDQSGSMRSKLGQARAAALAVLKTSNSQDEVALVTVGVEPRLALPFTSDSDKVADQLPSAAAEETALIDAIYLAMQVAHTGHNGRKAVMVISDGGENNSRRSLEELRSYALESDVQVYGMMVPKSWRQDGSSRIIVGRLCAITGGAYARVWHVQDLLEIAEHMQLLVRNQYVIGFRPGLTKPSGVWVKTKVKFEAHPELGKARVSARSGFYLP